MAFTAEKKRPLSREWCISHIFHLTLLHGSILKLYLRLSWITLQMEPLFSIHYRGIFDDWFRLDNFHIAKVRQLYYSYWVIWGWPLAINRSWTHLFSVLIYKIYSAGLWYLLLFTVCCLPYFGKDHYQHQNPAKHPSLPIFTGFHQRNRKLYFLALLEHFVFMEKLSPNKKAKFKQIYWKCKLLLWLFRCSATWAWSSYSCRKKSENIQ